MGTNGVAAPTADVEATGHPLVQELQQGHKMRSLDALLTKLDEDQSRHQDHTHLVAEGTSRLNTAQSTQALVTLGAPALVDDQAQLQPETPTKPKRNSYPDNIRAQVSAARSPLAPLAPDNVASDPSSPSHPSRPPKEGLSPVAPPKPREGPPRPAPAGRVLYSEADSGSPGSPPSAQGRTKAVVELGAQGQGFQRKVVPGSGSSNNEIDLLGRMALRKSVAQRKSVAAALLGVNVVRVRITQPEGKGPEKLPHDCEAVLSLAYHPCGQQLVAGGEDNKVTLWDVVTKQKLMEATLSSPVADVAFSPSGLYFAAGEIDAVVHVWSAQTRKQVGATRLPGEVRGVAMTSTKNGELLAVGTRADKVMLLSIPGLEEIAELQTDAGVNSVCFSPDGRMLVGGCGMGDLQALFSAKAGREMRTTIWQVAAQGHDCKFLGSVIFCDSVHATAFSPSGKLLAVAGENCAVTMLLTDRSFEKASELTCSAGVRCLAWSADSQLLASGGEDMQVSVWNVVSERVILQLPKARDWLCCLAFNSLSSCLAAGGFGSQGVTQHHVQVHTELVPQDALDDHSPARSAVAKTASYGFSNGEEDLDEEEEDAEPGSAVQSRVSMAIPTQALTSVCFFVQLGEPEEHGFNLTCPKGASPPVLAVAEIAEGSPLRPSGSVQVSGLEHGDELLTLLFSPDGSRLLVASEDRSLAVWDMPSRSKCMQVKLLQELTAAAYSPSGTFIAAADAGSGLTVWRAETQEEVGSATVDNEVLSLALGPAAGGEELLAVGMSSNKVLLFTVPELDPVAELQHSVEVRTLAFSPDGSGILVGSGGPESRGGILKTEGLKLTTVVWHTSIEAADCSVLGSILSEETAHVVAFAPSSQQFAFGDEGTSILLLRRVGEKFEHTASLPTTAGSRSLSWSSNSRLLASGGEDCRVSVWDVSDRTLLFQLQRADDWIRSISFSGDDRWLAWCSFGNNVAVLQPLEGYQAIGKRASELAQPTADYQSCGTVKFIPGQAPLPGTSAKTIVIPNLEDTGFKLKIESVGMADPKINLMQRVAMRKSIANRKSMASNLLGVGFQPVTLQSCGDRQKDMVFQHKDEVMTFAFGPPHSRRLASAGEDAALIMWDAETRAKLREVKLVSCAVCMAYSPSGLYVAVGTTNASVTVWEAETLEPVGSDTLEGNVLSVALTSDPRELLAVGTTAKKVMLLSLPDMEELADLRHDGHVQSVSFSATGGFLAGGGGTDEFHGLMTNKGEQHHMKTIIWQVTGGSECCKLLGQISFKDIVHTTAWSPSGKLLAVAGEDSMVSLLLVDRNYEKASELHCPAGIRCMSWCKGSRFLATAGEDMQVSVWDILTERVVLQLPKSQDWIRCIAWSENLDWLAYCAYGSEEVRLHPVEIVDVEENGGDSSQGSGRSSPADDAANAADAVAEQEVDGTIVKMFVVPDGGAPSAQAETPAFQLRVDKADSTN